MNGSRMTAQSVYRDMRIGFGEELCRLIDQPGWTDLMINPQDDDIVWVDTDKMRPVKCHIDRNGLTSAALILAAYSNVPFNTEGNQSLDGVVPVIGLRVNFVGPPAVPGICATFRRPSERVFTMEELISFGTITPTQVEFMKDAIDRHKNIVISGGTGSGKTSLGNSILTFINPEERIIVLEDVRELKMNHLPNHLSTLVNREYTYNDGIAEALRQRPTRILIGECRYGKQALEMLKAWNTGHPGGITTLHANSAEDVFRRLDQLCSEVSVSSQMEMIRDAIDVVVQMQRTPDNVRKITELLDVRENRYIE